MPDDFDAVRPTNPWRRADLQLPDWGVPVLVYCSSTGRHLEAAWDAARGCFRSEAEGRIEADYWMPIPELPGRTS